jgi:acetate kinase
MVFTAGVGEHQPPIRTAVCERLAWMGVELDAQANAANAGVISSATSRVTVLVLATDEEQVIADEAISILHEQGAPA